MGGYWMCAAPRLCASHGAAIRQVGERLKAGKCKNFENHIDNFECVNIIRV